VAFLEGINVLLFCHCFLLMTIWAYKPYRKILPHRPLFFEQEKTPFADDMKGHENFLGKRTIFTKRKVREQIKGIVWCNWLR
jgi:hypothetical protein